MATGVFGDDDKNHYTVLQRNPRKPSEKDGLLINPLVVRARKCTGSYRTRVGGTL